ncbi:hypothetical protein VNO78_18383 [Psophocarpus tetragonolobus]|uniref:Uncharacterized protein n=1 Tax=Psophocarpus tetragonolobus TaxID=3891 RepID=A0AAN9SIP7_PSOTE
MMVDNSRTQVGCVLLILLTISVLNHQVLGARFVKEVEHVLNKSALWRKSFKNETNGDSYATVNRVVPSSPDPLHNSVKRAVSFIQQRYREVAQLNYLSAAF